MNWNIHTTDSLLQCCRSEKYCKCRAVVVSHSILSTGVGSSTLGQSASFLLALFHGWIIFIYDYYFKKTNFLLPKIKFQLSSLEVPSAWRKVDVLREARATQLHFFDSLTQRQLMEEVFFLRRLQTIRDFFRLCSSFAQALSGKSSSRRNWNELTEFQLKLIYIAVVNAHSFHFCYNLQFETKSKPV